MSVIRVIGRPVAETENKATLEQRTYKVKYLVETDSMLDGPQVVLSDPRLPAFNSAYQFGNDYDGTSVLLTKSANPHEKQSTKWIVTCEYGPSPSSKNGEPTDNPLEQDPEVEVSFQQFTKPVEVAKFLGLLPSGQLSGILGMEEAPLAYLADVTKPMASSGEAFDPPAEMDDSRLIVRITRNEAALNDYNMLYQNAINSDDFVFQSRGLGLRVLQYSAKMQSIQAQAKSTILPRAALIGTGLLGLATIGREFVQVTYWTLTYEIALKPIFAKTTEQGWLHVLLDRGHAIRVKPGDADPQGGTVKGGEIVPAKQVPPMLQIIDARSHAPAQPHWLDGHGKLNAGLPVAEGGIGAAPTPVFSVWRAYDSLPFKRLGL